MSPRARRPTRQSWPPRQGTIASPCSSVWPTTSTPPSGSPADLDEAARAAAAAAPAWAALPRGERIAALGRLRGGISRERQRLEALIAREVGKPLLQARHELDMASELLESIGDEDLW